jgi:hypothetical protein
MNLRKLAQGKPCQIRIPAVCNGNRQTTVLWPGTAESA